MTQSRPRAVFRSWLPWLAAGALLACAATPGYLGGRLSAPGKPETGITFTYQPDQTDFAGAISVPLPGGEVFTGKYLQVTSVTPDIVLISLWTGTSAGPMWEDWGPMGDLWAPAIDLDNFRRNYSGKIVATLFGNRGNAMRCRFRLFDPSHGLRGGGTGECQISYGNGSVAVQF